MSVITLVPETTANVETPPAGYLRIFVSDVDFLVYGKKSDGSVVPLGTGGGSTLGGSISLLGVIDDVSAVGSPAAGDKYLIGAAPVGILTGNTNNIAAYDGAAWSVEIIPNNTIFDIIQGAQKGTYHNAGIFPSNTITQIVVDSIAVDHQLSTVDPDIQTAFNNGAAITINPTDSVFITWTRGGLIDTYAWAGLKDGTVWGSGGSGTAVAGDFIKLTETTTEFERNTFRVVDDVDPTKKIAFITVGITTGALRSITMPDFDVDLTLVPNAAQTDGSTPFTNPQTGVDAVAATDLVTLQQVQSIAGGGGSFFGEILSGDIDGTYIPIGTEKRYILTHNLNLDDKENFLWNMVDKLTGEAILPETMFAVDVNTLHIIIDGIFPTVSDGIYVTVTNGASAGSTGGSGGDILSANVTVNNTELASISTVPKEILAAQAGVTYELISVSMNFTMGTVAYVAPNDVELKANPGTANQTVATMDKTLVAAAPTPGTKFNIKGEHVTGGGVYFTEGEGIEITSASDITTGDGGVTIEITYKELSL